MHKFTIFTVILSVVTISIVVDIVVNGYSLSNDAIPERIDQAIIEIDELRNNTQAIEDDATLNAEPQSELVDQSTENTNTDSEIATETETAGDSNLNEELLEAISVEDALLKTVDYKPYHQAIEIEESLKKQLKIVNLFDFEEYLGTIYELQFQSTDEAMQYYSDLKAESLAVEGANIRETNSFGEQSYYFNQEGKTKTAFTTLQIGPYVYGFEYPHSSHQVFKEINTALLSK